MATTAPDPPPSLDRVHLDCAADAGVQPAFHHRATATCAFQHAVAVSVVDQQHGASGVRPSPATLSSGASAPSGMLKTESDDDARGRRRAELQAQHGQVQGDRCGAGHGTAGPRQSGQAVQRVREDQVVLPIKALTIPALP